MFMSNKERKSEQEAKTLIDKIDVAGGMGLLLLPEERPSAFDNFIAA